MKNIALIITLLFSMPVHACMGKLRPNIDNLEQYSEIYLAEVTGVVLTKYVELREESIKNKENRRWFSDITLPQQVDVIVERAFKGNPSIKASHKITGCAVVTPSPRMMGLFFVEKNSNKVIPIYENEGELYYQYLIQLGKNSANN